MTDTTDDTIRIAYHNDGFVTVEIEQMTDPEQWPDCYLRQDDLPEVPMIGVDFTIDNEPDPDYPGCGPRRYCGFWLTPGDATKLAHKLLTLADQAGP
jgi:hypothetical protein